MNKAVKFLVTLLILFICHSYSYACWDDYDDDWYDYDDDWDSYDYYEELDEVICIGSSKVDEDDWTDNWDDWDDDWNDDDYDWNDDDYDDYFDNDDESSYHDTEDVVGNYHYNQFGQTYTSDFFNLVCKFEDIVRIDNLPTDPPIQLFRNECVIDATALLISIVTGQDYDLIRFELLDKSEQLGYQVTGAEALPYDLVYPFINDAIEVKYYNFEETKIENAIDNGNPVLAIVPTGEYIYDNYVALDNATEIEHMVTIVAYDEFYYYSLVGDGYYTAIPKSDFDNTKNIYIKE